MKLDLSRYKVTLVLMPHDMRAGFPTLSAIAERELGICIRRGEDAVVFLSKRRTLAKIILTDVSGCTIISRTLHAGTFKRLCAAASGSATRPLTVKELCTYLDGGLPAA